MIWFGLSQTVCGIANMACVSTLRNAQGTSVDAGQITDTQMRCGNFTNVPNGYFGVELGYGALNTTVSGTASAGRCAVPPLQLVVLDGAADPSLSLCNNSNALVAGCTGYQGPFAAGQFYTQPAVSFGTVSVNGNVLYAVPFFSPASGGAITKLAIDVLNTGTKTCRVGVYNAFNGQPSTLITDGGTLSGTGTLVTSATLTPSVQLAPQTLYFLAVGCSGNAMLLGALNNVGAASGPLTGSPTTYADTTTQITATWTFSSGALPTIFGNGTITSAAGSIPNVYAGP